MNPRLASTSSRNKQRSEQLQNHRVILVLLEQQTVQAFGCIEVAGLVCRHRVVEAIGFGRFFQEVFQAEQVCLERR